MRMVRKRSAYPGTQAVRRAIGLLKAFTPEQPRRRVVELSRALGLNKTTAYRLLTALESEGMVEREGEVYRLGPELLALGARACGVVDLRAAARVELESLAAETRETATLEMLVGRHMLILDEVRGHYVLGTLPWAGTRWPVHATSTGKVLMADMPADALEVFLGDPLEAFTTRTITDAAAFRRELARVRQRGYAISAEELEPGFVAVGAPVRAAGGRVVASLSLGGPKVRLTQEQLSTFAEALVEAAGRASQRLGFKPERRIGRAG